MKGLQKQKGFTLLEVMVSLAIVAGLLMTLIYTLNYNLGITERQFAITKMTYLAKEKIEELELVPQETQGHFPEPHELLNYETKVRDSFYPEILEISAAVGDGKTRIVLSRLIPKPPPEDSMRREGKK